MASVEEAQLLLKEFGLPPGQSREMAGYTLLAIAKLAQDTAWSEASRRSINIRSIINYISDVYGKVYLDRESIRRQVVKHLVQAQILDLNFDNLRLPPNSPQTHYSVSDAALPVLRAFGSPRFARLLTNFHRQHARLQELYATRREASLVRIELPDGVRLALSPGKHNELQASVVRQFLERFTIAPKVLYLGDTANKSLYVDSSALNANGISVSKNEKLPDIIVTDENKSRIFLIEVVTSHGPVSPIRFLELTDLLSECDLTPAFVTAFPNVKEFMRHLRNIAWETEVWIAETPDHLIHFDGERFLPNS